MTVMHFKRKQSGHAALLFAMLIPTLFGIFTLASDGARAIQSKARIEDAAEVASLAIAAHNAQNKDSTGIGSGSLTNRKIATNYIEQYMVDMTQISDLKIYKHNCEEISECKEGLTRGGSRFSQYEVQAKTKHTSWFPGNEVIQGFGETFDVAGTAVARKYQSEAVDVVFAADFSGSMSGGWPGSRQAKYRDLIEIIKEVTFELKRFNDLGSGNNNKIAISPFNYYTYSNRSDNTKKKCDLSQEYYSRGSFDAKATVDNLWKPKGNEVSDNHCNGERNKHQFKDIFLTSNFDSFNATVRLFKPGGGTTSYQSIIRSAQMLRKGVNSRRLLIVISDGDDSGHFKKRHQSLVQAGMCTKILLGLGAGMSSDGKPIRARMAVIGFDYEPENNKALQDCVGVKNVYKAEKRSEILNQILELITEEIGHLK